MGLRDQQLIVFDGSCGVSLQALELPPDAWGERCAGCNEYLNLSRPDVVTMLHREFLDAGADVLETNTFGGTAIVLAEYGLEGRVADINRAAVAAARAAIDGRPGKWIAGSIGPTTKLPSLGHVPPAALAAAFREQIAALVDAGVDLLIIETCQDLLQAKLAVIEAFDAVERSGRDVPVMLSVTMETTGTLLVGTDLAAVIATFEPYPLFALGLNCATGPARMAPHVEHLAAHWPGRISVIPNAGIPEVVDGASRYPLTPADLGRHLRDYVARLGVSIVGGCCGTTPAHIRALADAVRGVAPAPRQPRYAPSLSSAFAAVETAQEIPPLMIGERMNVHGSRKFKKLLLADDFEGAARIGLEQERQGAHLVDLCTAYTERDEAADLTRMIGLLNGRLRAPLVIDSTNPASVEAALAAIPGRALVNSINLEDGGATAARVLRAARRHGAAVIALTIDAGGMAMTADDKLAVARELHRLAVDEHGLRPSDLFFDALTFSIGAGDPKLVDAAAETLAAIPRIKAELPGVRTVLGVSNVSFGLPAAARKYLNSVFLHEALQAGLDAAIVDAAKILPLAAIPEVDREICLDLIYDRRAAGGGMPLERLIDHFTDKTGDDQPATEAPGTSAPEQELEAQVVDGNKEGLADLIRILLERHPPLELINQVLVPAMRRVGDLFGRGEMLLPFVLRSAEVMKAAVALLEPHLDQSAASGRTRVLLATVQGDVHDIGKNLVDIILSNNGYEVVNLGTNVPLDAIIEAVREHRVDAVGLSGLLVKSALAMQQSLPQLAAAGVEVPVLLGGAALTRRFVGESCAPGHPAPVVYCPDAFAGLRAIQALERGDLRATEYHPPTAAPVAEAAPREEAVARLDTVPEPPFRGRRAVLGIEPGLLLPHLNREALFRGRWGYRQRKLADEEYAAIIEHEARPALAALERRLVEERLVEPRVVYGYFGCRADGERLVVERDGREHVFEFPRQQLPPHLCIADYFRDAAAGGDVAGFFVATIGAGIVDQARALFEQDRYQDYLLLHGFAAELTDALAAYWHEVMTAELGIGETSPGSGIKRRTQAGCRYGFGYSSCPDLAAHRPLFELLEPAEIGVGLTENMQLVPEVTTSAILAHHPQARYFAV